VGTRQAANDIIAHFLKHKELADIEKRIEAIEEQLTNTSKTACLRLVGSCRACLGGSRKCVFGPVRRLPDGLGLKSHERTADIALRDSVILFIRLATET
jgi:hypothetical protein